MSYIDNNLLSGEKVIYRAKLHWFVFIWPIIWLVLSIITLSGGEEGAALGGLFIILTIVTGISSTISYLTSEFGITDKRILIKAGFIRRNSVEVLLKKVEGIQVNQGIIGRMLNFGTIIIGGTGGTKSPFKRISAPLMFRRKAQEQIVIVEEGRQNPQI